MKSSLPSEFLDACTPEQRKEADSWWANLASASKSEIYVLLDTRNDSRAFVFAADDEGERNWHILPISNDALPSDLDEDNDSWITELVHYRLDHEDFVMASDMKVRTFHICSQHASVRTVIASGEISSDFRCSICDPNCPMLRIASSMQRGKLLAHNRKTNFTVWLCR